MAVPFCIAFDSLAQALSPVNAVSPEIAEKLSLQTPPVRCPASPPPTWPGVPAYPAKGTRLMHHGSAGSRRKWTEFQPFCVLPKPRKRT